MCLILILDSMDTYHICFLHFYTNTAVCLLLFLCNSKVNTCLMPRKFIVRKKKTAPTTNDNALHEADSPNILEQIVSENVVKQKPTVTAKSKKNTAGKGPLIIRKKRPAASAEQAVVEEVVEKKVVEKKEPDYEREAIAQLRRHSRSTPKKKVSSSKKKGYATVSDSGPIDLDFSKPAKRKRTEAKLEDIKSVLDGEITKVSKKAPKPEIEVEEEYEEVLEEIDIDDEEALYADDAVEEIEEEMFEEDVDEGEELVPDKVVEPRRVVSGIRKTTLVSDVDEEEFTTNKSSVKKPSFFTKMFAKNWFKKGKQTVDRDTPQRLVLTKGLVRPAWRYATIIQAIILIAGATYVYRTGSISLTGSSTVADVVIPSTGDADTDALLKEVSQFVILPTSTPTVATVSDKSKLTNAPFYDQVENGDKVLLYPVEKKAIVYRPNAKRVVDITSIQNDNAQANNQQTNQAVLGAQTAPVQATPMPTPVPTEAAVPNSQDSEVNDSETTEKVQVVLLNGSETVGITSKVEKSLEETFDNVVVVAREAAKESYDTSFIAPLSNLGRTNIEQVSSHLKVDVGAAPDKEEVEKADLVVIIGSDYK